MVLCNLDMTHRTDGGGEPVRVTVRAPGSLKHHRPDGQERFTLDLPAGATVRMLIDASGIPWEEVGMAAVNGKQATDDSVLAEGDEVMLLVPLEGG